MSAKGMPHCDTPASTDALPLLPSDAVTCRHSVVPNRARATQFAIALIAPVAAITAHDVAARASGDSIEFGGKEKSIGWNVAEAPVHINDFHATLLHLFGLNHEALTYRFEGRDFRLTDVAGKVIEPLLA